MFVFLQRREKESREGAAQRIFRRRTVIEQRTPCHPPLANPHQNG